MNWGDQVSRKNKEFEQSRQDVLRMAREMGDKRKAEVPLEDKSENKLEGERKYAWEFEILEYRRKKRIEKFLVFGATCGVLSLIITVTVNWSQIINLIN